MTTNKFAAYAVMILSMAVAASAQTPSVNSLSWMTGCWETSENGRTTTERWAAPTDNLMLGTSQTVRGGKSVAFEFLRVVNNAQGMAYIAKPSSAQTETSFAFLKASEKEVVFENLKHDFPQRIIYKADKADSLSARIEGMQNGKLAGMDIPMKRVKCE
jgi:hypothetical protein